MVSLTSFRRQEDRISDKVDAENAMLAKSMKRTCGLDTDSRQVGFCAGDASCWLLKQMLIAHHLIRSHHARRHATHPH